MVYCSLLERGMNVNIVCICLSWSVYVSLIESECVIACTHIGLHRNMNVSNLLVICTRVCRGPERDGRQPRPASQGRNLDHDPRGFLLRRPASSLLHSVQDRQCARVNTHKHTQYSHTSKHARAQARYARMLAKHPHRHIHMRTHT